MGERRGVDVEVRCLCDGRCRQNFTTLLSQHSRDLNNPIDFEISVYKKILNFGPMGAVTILYCKVDLTSET